MPSAAPRDRARTALVVVLALLPALAVGGLTAGYAVDVPYWDEWALTPFLLRSLDGSLTFSDLWQQHNEHRPLVARAVLVALARMTAWSVPAELALIFGLFSLAFLGIVAALRAARPPATRPLWLLPSMAVLVFSPSQWENWLWGWQVMLALQYAATVASLALLSGGPRTTMRVALAACFAAIATFSFATGLVTWVVGLVALLTDAARKEAGAGKRAALWLTLGAGCAVAYFSGYEANPHHPTVTASLAGPAAWWRLAKFVLVFLAAPLVGPATRAGLAVGLGLVLALGGMARASIRFGNSGADRPRVYFGVLLGLDAVGNAVLIGLGRAEFGVVPSRYFTLATPMTLAAMIGLGEMLSSALPRRSPVGQVRPWLRAAVVAMVTAGLAGWPRGAAEFRGWHQRLAPARAALVRGDSDLDRLAPLYLVPGLVIQWRPALERHHLGPFRHAAPAPGLETRPTPSSVP